MRRGATTPNPLSSSGLDRASAVRRSAEELAELAAHPEARMIVVRPPHVLVADGPVPHRVEVAAADGLLLLGLEDGVATFAVDADEAEAVDAGSAGWKTLLEVGGSLSQRDGSLFAQAIGLVNWHRRHRFCAACGSPTEVRWAGYLRACPACQAEHFPRLDPAVIMLVTSGDRCVLGRQPAWPPTMFSALAGFVEPGESLEDAVRREVCEEIGVEVGDVRYHSSQPWPFPSSLMLGFFATALSEDLHVDPSELDGARWFGRAEIPEAIERGDLMLPGTISIARCLVEAWLQTTD
jgi:NAD+ diphosphatase